MKANEDKTPKAEAIDLTSYVQYGDGSIVSKIILKREKGNITLFSFDEGQSLSEHTAPYDAFVQILDGRANITIGGESKDVGSGEFIIMPANVPHSVLAKEKFKMLLTMIRSD